MITAICVLTYLLVGAGVHEYARAEDYAAWRRLLIAIAWPIDLVMGLAIMVIFGSVR